MKETYRCEYVRCGKRNCRSCPHGPYWYAYWKESGRTRSRYVGKKAPRDPRQSPDAPAGERKRPHPWDKILNKQTASLKLACEILGVPTNVSQDEATRVYRRKSLEYHPDRGGEARDFAWLSAAWSYLRWSKSWK